MSLSAAPTGSPSYSAIADLNLWIKTQANDKLTLADIPNLIPYRWPFIRDNWQTTLLPNLLNQLSTFSNPSLLKNQIDLFTVFIDNQRTSNPNINPLSPSNVFFAYYLVFDALTIDTAPVDATEQNVINAAITRINDFAKTDFENIINSITISRDQLADSVGGTDATYNSTFERKPIAASVPISIPAVQQMQIYNDTITNVQFIIANLYGINNNILVDPFALARANANNPNFNMASYTSGKLVKLAYGESLLSLAYRYLGSPDKWIDIAIANGLKPPYIDEVGESIPFLSNGDGNQFNVPQLDPNGNYNINNFYVNQVVILQSSAQTFPDQRTITNIKQIPVSNELVIEVNGANNLDIYEADQGANVRVFAPNTINSQFFVLIPSTDPSPIPSAPLPYFLQSDGQDEILAKVDLLLDQNGDINFNSSGDLQLSYGINNAVQAIKLKLLIEQGALMRHPEFGFVVMQGLKNANGALNQSMIVKCINAQVESDPRFDRVESLNVEYLGYGLGGVGYYITLTVRMAGSNIPLPISFTINTS